jgi:membrane protein DedA with SNARE-associated domain
MEFIAPWITHYGYVAIFSLLVLGIVGLPIPDEWLMAFAGYLVFKHQLHLAPALASAVLGSMCGITISYILGRSIGLYALHRYGRFLRITPEGINKTHAAYDRYGTWLLFFGYFIPGVRHFTAIVAGTVRMRPAHFSAFAYSGALAWSSAFIGIGYLLGDEWATVLQQIHHHLTMIAWMALALVVAWLGWVFRRNAIRNRC